MNWELILFLAIGLFTLSLGTLIYTRKRRRKQQPPYTQALSLLLAGEKEKALEKLRQAVKEDTENIDAYILYGDILREMGQHRQAVKIHRELTIREKLTPGLRSKLLRSLVLDHFEGRDLRQALPYIEQMLSISRSDIWALNMKLSLHETLENWKTAFEVEKKIQSITRKFDKEKLGLYRVMEGKKLLKSGGREHDARLRFRAAIKIDKASAPAYLELADSYIREGRTKDALDEWRIFFKKNPLHAHLAFDQLEKVVFDLGRFEELESIYRQLVQDNPKNTRAVVALAKFLDRKGETSEAIEVCRYGLEKTPESLWIRRNLFRFLAADNQLGEAMKLGLEILDMVMEEREAFICSKCGYLSVEPQWRCPKCKNWRSFRL